MKKIKNYFVVLFIILSIFYVASFIYFTKSLDVTKIMYIPCIGFPLFTIEKDYVTTNIINAVILSAILAVPISILFSLISKPVPEQLKKKGKN